MELRQLRYFVTVAEEMHFGRAAERLHIVQPAVSQQIRRLERELGVELFDRSPRHVRLTAAGQRFLPEARAVLMAADHARAVVADLVTARADVLRLGTSAGLGEHLDRVLDALRRRAPHTGVELVSAPTRARLDQVAAGQLDASFVRGVSEHPGLRFIPVWQDPLLAVLPAHHPLATDRDVAIADLATLPLRLTPRRNNPALVDLVLSACRDAGFEPLPGPPATRLEDTLAVIGSSTPMWTVVYASHARLLRSPRVAFLPFRAPGISIATALAVHESHSPPQLDLLLDACAMPAHSAPDR